MVVQAVAVECIQMPLIWKNVKNVQLDILQKEKKPTKQQDAKHVVPGFIQW